MFQYVLSNFLSSLGILLTMRISYSLLPP